jgi:hypothetical protein
MLSSLQQSYTALITSHLAVYIPKIMAWGEKMLANRKRKEDIPPLNER